MKKIFCIFFVALATTQVFARETVTIYYAFSPADTMANYSRTLVAEANRIQNKYTFVFDTKPGAGNAVAANFVRNNPNTILATSSAFFTRPIFYPNESYSVSQFRELLPQCDSPMVIVSLKYRSWNQVPTDQRLTIGVSGLGVTTHLVAMQIIARYPNMQVIPFKSTNDAILATVAGQIDFAVGFFNDGLRWTTQDTAKDKRLTMLGVTGTRSINGVNPLSQQGFPQSLTSMSAPHHLVVPISVSEEKFADWRSILFKASKAKPVQDSYAVDHAVQLDHISDDNIQPWFHKQHAQWKKLSQGVQLDR